MAKCHCHAESLKQGALRRVPGQEAGHGNEVSSKVASVVFILPSGVQVLLAMTGADACAIGARAGNAGRERIRPREYRRIYGRGRHCADELGFPRGR
jgi:hypothetical protein